jgi:hypothetical protein
MAQQGYRSTDNALSSSFGKLFPTTRVIIDATEIPIQKPGDVAGNRIGLIRVCFSSVASKCVL